MNEAFNFSQNVYYGHDSIKAKIIDNELWFNVKDICKILSIQRYSQLLARLSSDKKREELPFCSDRKNDSIFINELGIRDLCNMLETLNNDTKKATQIDNFTNWIFEDVIPTIRKVYGDIDHQEFVQYFLPFADKSTQGNLKSTLIKIYTAHTLKKANEELEKLWI